MNSRIKYVFDRFVRNKCYKTKYYVAPNRFDYDRNGLVYTPIVRNGRINRENKCEVLNGKLKPCKEKIKCLDSNLKEITSTASVVKDRYTNDLSCVYKGCKNRCNNITKDCWKNENGLITLHNRYDECDTPVDNSKCKKLDEENSVYIK